MRSAHTLILAYVEKYVYLYGLVVGANFLVGAQHVVERLEHVTHTGLGHRAFHDYHEFRLVGGGPDQAPGAVLNCDTYAIDRHEIADRLPRYSGALRLCRLEMLYHLVDDAIFGF